MGPRHISESLVKNHRTQLIAPKRAKSLFTRFCDFYGCTYVTVPYSPIYNLKCENNRLAVWGKRKEANFFTPYLFDTVNFVLLIYEQTRWDQFINDGTNSQVQQEKGRELTDQRLSSLWSVEVSYRPFSLKCTNQLGTHQI